MENEQRFATETCRAFYQYWSQLEGGGRIPHSRTFLDRADPKLISNVFIIEIAEQGQVIRFMGTALVEMWGNDSTNKVFGADYSEQAMDSLQSNTKAVAEHPCGLVEVSEFVTRSGLSFQMETVLLPLGVDEGRPPRICSFSQLLTPLTDSREEVARYREKQQARWIDIGRGLPNSEPAYSV